MVVAAAGTAVWLLVGAEKPYKGYEAAEQFVEIPPGAGPALIGRRLAEAGVVRDSSSFRAALARSGQARRLQAGEYRFDQPMSARGGRLTRSHAATSSSVRSRFREGLTIRQMAQIYEREGGGSRADFVARRQKRRADS